MIDYRFTDGDLRATARFFKTGWYLNVFNTQDQSFHQYEFPVEPKVKPLIEAFRNKSVGGLVGVLLRLPHKELE